MAINDPADPFGADGGLPEAAAHTAELFAAFTKAGIPPVYVAVMLGTWMANAGNMGQEPGDGH